MTPPNGVERLRPCCGTCPRAPGSWWGSWPCRGCNGRWGGRRQARRPRCRASAAWWRWRRRTTPEGGAGGGGRSAEGIRSKLWRPRQYWAQNGSIRKWMAKSKVKWEHSDLALSSTVSRIWIGENIMLCYILAIFQNKIITMIVQNLTT